MRKIIWLVVVFIMMIILSSCHDNDELPSDLKIPLDYTVDQILITPSYVHSLGTYVDSQNDKELILENLKNLRFNKCEFEVEYVNLVSVTIDGLYNYLVDEEGIVFVYEGAIDQQPIWYQSTNSIDINIINKYLEKL